MKLTVVSINYRPLEGLTGIEILFKYLRILYVIDALSLGIIVSAVTL